MAKEPSNIGHGKLDLTMARQDGPLRNFAKYYLLWAAIIGVATIAVLLWSMR
jgi:hypothetical protein